MRFIFLALLCFTISCGGGADEETPRSSDENFPGIITCRDSEGFIILHARAGDWRFNLNSENPMNAPLEGGGNVRITGNHVTFLDEDGNRIYLLNYPCRLSYPEVEQSF